MAITVQVKDLLDRATPNNVRYIKLGKKSTWWKISKQTNTLRIGFRKFDYQLCATGEWEKATRKYAVTSKRSRPSDITRAANQVREFFELPKSVLWITIEEGDLYWCFANEKVENIYDGDDEKETREGARIRRIIGGWCNEDVKGNRLRLDTMTTKITKVSSFQETICKPGGAADVLRRIRCEHSQEHGCASQALESLTKHVGDLLDQLHQNDFELLIELIFSHSGWQRISAVGGQQKTLDMALTLPTTNENYFVQVKSQTDEAVFRKLNEALANYSGYSRMFFVYHTPSVRFENPNPGQVTVWSRYDIAQHVINAGLVNWLLARTS